MVVARPNQGVIETISNDKPLQQEREWSPMNAAELYRAGQLAEAIAAATDEVKRHPSEANLRGFLAELLCFAGDFERADKQMDALGHQDPQSMVGVSLFRQLLRAAQARQQFHAEGRLPEFLEQPSSRLKRHLEASISLREGRPAEAAALLDAAEEERLPLAGTSDGRPFDDLRDVDDLTSSFFEVLTTTGKYYWIPMERVEVVEFHEPVRPRDLLWRRVHMVVQGGPDGEVFLPVLYPGSQTDPDDRVKLGRATNWRGGEGAPVQGVGQRMFVLGEEDASILQLKQITITASAPEAEDGEDRS
jgi:type VI secretion system protein ImpE